MNITVPQSFIEVSKRDFHKALASVNYSRDTYVNCVKYNAIGYEKVIPSQHTTSAQSVYSIPKTVAISTHTGHFFLDPEFFK